ncbi:MotA/TolQ/ExbB proton channel family protein [Nitrococcus mobilis Nb-231]|uniref:Biopolymer transport protein ExbB n=1 Tax=Nitrococcus mobilis Nb-231 TaxID=314278 RepID=A4BKW9_9GAMM|nr:MotA/TolQ/ExbB proton channel family protein [Nitrococcus mobilis Nb-231]
MTVETEHALGFINFLQQADGLAKTILALMLFASLISWYLILTKTVHNSLAIRRSRQFLEFFWATPSLTAVAAHLEEQQPKDPFSRLAHHGVIASSHHERYGVNRVSTAGSAGDFVTRALRKVIDEETARAESGLTLLASIGSTAPFVGLLGTVWGIYHALIAIAQSGSGGLDQVAGPVGEALIMTAIGLAVAIPAVLGYNFLVRSNRLMLARLDGFAYDLFAFLATGAKLDGQAQPTEVVAHLRTAEPAVAGRRS